MTAERDSIRQLKTAQRKQCTDARRAMTESDRSAASREICARLAAMPEARSAAVIMSYAAAWDEADMSIFNAWALAEGKTVAYPITRGGGEMDAAVPVDETAFERGKFGIYSPVRERSQIIAPESIDLIIVPCVGFDGACRRLGHGGGYYDRFLGKCPSARCIAVAFEAQRLDAAACEEHDRPVDAVVTEKTIYR